MDKIEGCTPGVVFRLNQQCSLACRCREGLAEFIQCPDGLAYDSPTDKCLSLNIARWYVFFGTKLHLNRSFI